MAHPRVELALSYHGAVERHMAHPTVTFSVGNDPIRGLFPSYTDLVVLASRMVAWGGASLVLGIYLWISGNKGTEIGTFLTLTLLGDAIISYILTLTADKIGRRKVLFIGSLLMVVAGTTFAFSKNYYLLLWAAIIGVIAPGAHEVGPFRAVQVRWTNYVDCSLSPDIR